MAHETSPAFQFYVKEWRSSRAVQRMSFAERGMYFEMLCEQWEALSLPDDAGEVATLIATTDAQTAEIQAAWPVLRRKFAAVEDQPGRIANLRLERVRREKRAFVRLAKKGGKARAAQAARNDRGTFQQATSSQPAGAPAGIQPEHQQESQPQSSRNPAAPPAVTQPSSSSSPSSSTASSSSTATAKDGARRAAGAPPLNLGLRRFKVWRWMLDDLIDALGAHAETFDLDGWLQALDAKETRVISDSWPWLKTEMLAEAKRRGLPCVEASDRKPMFSQSSREMGEAVLANLNRETGLPR